MRGQGSLGNDQPVFPGNPLRNDALKPRAFDPDKAKFHLNKAGMIGQTIAITASDAVGSYRRNGLHPGGPGTRRAVPLSDPHRDSAQHLSQGAPAVIVPSIAIATLTISVNLFIDNLPRRIRDRSE